MEWCEPWRDIAAEPSDFAAAFERQLGREVGPGHPLHGVPVEAIGRREDCDDVLFRLLDGSERVAVVRLTWPTSGPERSPWPDTTIHPGLDVWAVEVRAEPG